MCVKNFEQKVEIDRNRHLKKRKQEEAHIERERGCRQINTGIFHEYGQIFDCRKIGKECS